MKERYRPYYERRGYFRRKDRGLTSGPVILLYLTTAAVMGLVICSDQYTQPSPNRKTSITEPFSYNPGTGHIETIAGITIDHRDGGFLIKPAVLATQVIDPVSR